MNLLLDGNVRLTVPGSSNIYYSVEAAVAVAPASWISLITNKAAAFWEALFPVEWWKQRPLPPAHASLAPPYPHRSTSNSGLEVLRWGYGVARGAVGCRVGGIGGQRLDGLGCQAGFGWVPQTREEPQRSRLSDPQNPSNNPGPITHVKAFWPMHENRRLLQGPLPWLARHQPFGRGQSPRPRSLR